MVAAWSTQSNTSGGSRLTEQKALTVIPRSAPRGSRTVTMVTPDAKRPSTLRKVSASIMRPLRRPRSGCTPRKPKHAPKILQADDLPRGNEVARDANEKIGECLATRQPVRRAIDERRRGDDA